MSAPSVDIKDMLIADLGFVYAQNIFVGRLPDAKNRKNSVAVVDTQGPPRSLTLNAKNERYEYPSVQIMVRHNDYTDGWDRINSIVNSLHGRANETWNGSTYTLIACVGGPALLYWDEGNLVHFIANFNIQRR